MRYLQSIAVNWKTTATGVALILAALATAISGLANGEPVQWELVLAELITGVGLVAGRDGDKSTEESVTRHNRKPKF